jgi:cytochrome b subunit of formate dehydrogenase
MYTTLNNKANLTKTSLLFPTFMFKATSIKETAAEERIMNEHKYETSYITYRKFPKFNLFGMKKEIISVVAICLVSLAGIILFFTFGGNFEVSLSKNSLGSVLNSVIISFAIAMGIIAAYSFIRLN